jgi:hypothetical protein
MNGVVGEVKSLNDEFFAKDEFGEYIKSTANLAFKKQVILVLKGQCYA